MGLVYPSLRVIIICHSKSNTDSLLREDVQITFDTWQSLNVECHIKEGFEF